MSSPAIRRITQAGVVGALALGVSGVVVMDKSVALSVDGEKSTVHAFGGTVGDVLEKQGVELGPHDVVTPSAESPVDDGQTIVVRYGRKLTVTVDGKEREYWTTASTVGEALQQLGIRNGDGAILSASRSQTIGRNGLDLRVSTPKQVKLLVGGKRSTATVTATTVEDALTQAEVRYDGNDLIKPGAKSRVTDGMTIRLDRVNRTGDTRTEVIPYETVVKKDSSLYEGETKLQQEGRAGSRTITYRVSKKNGEVVYSRQTMVKVTAEPVDRIVLQGTKARPAPTPETTPKATATPKTKTKTKTTPTPTPTPTPTATSTPKPSTPSPEPTSTPTKTASPSGLDLSRADMWDRIAQCESTGNWSINSGNGYYGGLQFDLQTWLSAGGGDFASRPDLASREQQITVANRVYADRGLQPWGCAHAA